MVKLLNQKYMESILKAALKFLFEKSGHFYLSGMIFRPNFH